MKKKERSKKSMNEDKKSAALGSREERNKNLKSLEMTSSSIS